MKNYYTISIIKRAFTVKVNFIDSTGGLCGTIILDPNKLDVQSSEIYIGKNLIIDKLTSKYKKDIEHIVASLREIPVSNNFIEETFVAQI